MVPKRSKTSGSSQPGAAARRRRRARPSSNVTSPNVTPPPQPESEPAPTADAEADTSSHAPATTAEDTTRRALSPIEVTEAIEYERAELLQVQAMLKCLYEVLLYADDDDSVMHADVAQVCARLIHESVCRLGDLLMQGCAPDRSNAFDEAGVSE